MFEVADERPDLLGQFPRRPERPGDHGGQRQVQWRHEQAPVIAHRFIEERLLVGLQGLGEQGSAVEGMLAQHAVAPAMDGRDRGLVHPFGSHLEPARQGRPLLGRIVRAQEVQRIVGVALRSHLRVDPKDLRRFDQPEPDAIAQFLSGRLGEGEHQDLGRGECARMRVHAAMTEHQAHIQQREGEGFSSAGAGLDQAAAVQRKAQRVERSRRLGVRWAAHRVSPALDGAGADFGLSRKLSRSGPSSARARVANSPPACRDG